MPGAGLRALRALTHTPSLLPLKAGTSVSPFNPSAAEGVRKLPKTAGLGSGRARVQAQTS